MLSFKPALPANLFIGIIFLGCIYTHGGGGGLVNKSCLTLVIPWTVAYQAPLSMGFSRQASWSGLPFPSPEDLPDPGMEPGSPALQADVLLSEPPGKPGTGNPLQYSRLENSMDREAWETTVHGVTVSQTRLND